MIKTAEKTQIARAACARWDKFPNLTVAKMLYKAHRHLWPSLEACRSSVRKVRGSHGQLDRKRAGDKSLHRPLGKAGFTWEFPRSSAPDYRPFHLENCRALILSDLHIPFHDGPAVRAVVERGRKDGCNLILLNGDVCDFFSISRFDKNPTESSLKAEMTLTRQFLGWLREQFPQARIIYKLGNHDEWFDKYLFRKAPELYGVDGLTLRHLLTERIGDIPEVGGIEWVEDQRKIYAGKLAIWHGHEIGKGSIAPPVNPARGLFLRTLECGLMGHLHKRSSHEETSSNGKLIACWSTGCLCGLWPRYARINKWGHSAALLELVNGQFNVEELRVLNGRIL